MSVQDPQEEEPFSLMRAEAQAFLDEDIDALASHWGQTKDTARLMVWPPVSTKVMRGSVDVFTPAKAGLKRYSSNTDR